MPAIRSAGRILAAAALGLAVWGAGASDAAATTKPARDTVPTGATVLYWSSGLGTVTRTPSGEGVVTVTKAAVIAHVRALINSLPVSSTLNRVCPDDLI